uniref:IclR family transcriptional regulator n=1 Tax=Steinernema glaseri TaxID=37863 RepID=A0A1I7Y4K9_9BILA
MDFLCVVMELVVVEEKKLVPAVVRAVTVLDELAASPEPLSFTDLVKRLGMPKSSLYGLCTTLLDLHLIRKLENGSFTLGTHVMGWANAFLSQLDLTQEFFAAWDDMRVLPEETITLSILDGEDVVYIACRNGTRPLGFTFRAGMRLPAVYTATGKAMLSTLPDACGVRDGMHCFGAAVFDSNNRAAVAGVAVSLLTQEADEAAQRRAGEAMRKLANRLSERLGASRKA